MIIPENNWPTICQGMMCLAVVPGFTTTAADTAQASKCSGGWEGFTLEQRVKAQLNECLKGCALNHRWLETPLAGEMRELLADKSGG